jgi:hypothetical protein
LSKSVQAGAFGIVATNEMGAGHVELGAEGQKQSGFGVEGGLAGLAAYSTSTTTNLYI